MTASGDSVWEILGRFGLQAGARVEFDWEEIEENLGVLLPREYKVLSERYPSGWFRRFVRLSPPSRSLNRSQRLLDDFEVSQMEMLRVWHADGQIKFPYPLYPVSGGLLLWGSLRGGGYAFWLTGAEDPNDWTVVIASQRCGHWEHFDGNVSDFLAEVVEARYDATGFSDGPFRVVTDAGGNTRVSAPPIVLAERPVFEPDSVPQ
jgi:hypothetical protein